MKTIIAIIALLFSVIASADGYVILDGRVSGKISSTDDGNVRITFAPEVVKDEPMPPGCNLKVHQVVGAQVMLFVACEAAKFVSIFGSHGDVQMIETTPNDNRYVMKALVPGINVFRATGDNGTVPSNLVAAVVSQ